MSPHKQNHRSPLLDMNLYRMQGQKRNSFNFPHKVIDINFITINNINHKFHLIDIIYNITYALSYHHLPI